MQKPDHNTINNFRGKRIEPVLKLLFRDIVIHLHEAGLLTLKDIYTDGTKLEANANKFTFIWKKAVQGRQEKMLDRIHTLWDYAVSVTKQEVQETKPESPEELTPDRVQSIVDALNKSLQGYEIGSKKKAQIRRAVKEYPEQARRNNKALEELADKNSCSKTDKDATFMRMKEDHMNNGHLKAAYNWQISTNNQFIVNYTVHQTAGDTTTLIPHLEQYCKLYETKPEEVTADAGYGSEENYTYLEANEIIGFVKFNMYDKETKKKYVTDISKSGNFYYNEKEDCFYCTIGQKLSWLKTQNEKSKTGFVQELSYYEAQNCEGCPLRAKCFKAVGNRIIKVNHKLRKLRETARQRLNSPEGIIKKVRRTIEPEAVFGQIKQNKGYRRLMLRGQQKVEIELGIMAIAHNLSKIRV